MSWLGKILGGGIGMVAGGPLGAVLGAVLGHQLLDRKSGLSAEESQHGVFFLATFAMLGKLSKADGRVTAEEVSLVEQIMTENLRLPPDARRFAIDIFNRAKDSDDEFLDYAEQFYDAFAHQPEVLASMVDLLLRLAHADGVKHPAEDALIESAVKLFGVHETYQQLQARYGDGNDLERCYGVLGVSADDSLAVIKKQYRRLAMQYHPDRVVANGVAPELVAASEARFKEIQQAYEVLERHLG